MVELIIDNGNEKHIKSKIFCDISSWLLETQQQANPWKFIFVELIVTEKQMVDLNIEDSMVEVVEISMSTQIDVHWCGNSDWNLLGGKRLPECPFLAWVDDALLRGI